MHADVGMVQRLLLVHPISWVEDQQSTDEVS